MLSVLQVVLSIDSYERLIDYRFVSTVYIFILYINIYMNKQDVAPKQQLFFCVVLIPIILWSVFIIYFAMLQGQCIISKTRI